MAHGGSTGLLWNVAGVLLLAWANFFDSADGQLARMTGKKTQLGRILDGAASEVWFIPIYCALVWRFYQHHALTATLLLFVAVLYSGFHCHAGQCALADYYRQAHLYFLKGEAGSELNTSEQQQRLYDSLPWRGNLIEKTFLKAYVNYTRKQERMTPHFQQLMKRLHQRYGTTENIPETFRNVFQHHSLPLMKWTNILTFNTRAIVLYACCLADFPWLYFVFEIVVMSALSQYMRYRHEQFCKQLCADLQ